MTSFDSMSVFLTFSISKYSKILASSTLKYPYIVQSKALKESLQTMIFQVVADLQRIYGQSLSVANPKTCQGVKITAGIQFR